ncbi:MAG TPA: hypothetical protein DEB24_06330 [Coriobacteriia bacterium]|nr:hypothetical protein [Coriobacteriia bacterium]
MCFRPAGAEVPPYVCANCGKTINRVADQLPKKCPFCKTPTEDTGQTAIEQAPPPKPPSAPPVPPSGTPSAPKPPTGV